MTDVISIFIVSYNSAQHIQKCIDSILSQKNVIFDVTVIDNASEDQSVELLRTYGDKIKLIVNSKNVGFGRANNQIAQHARGNYFFLLNPDAYFSKPTDLKNLLDFIQQNPDCGLAAPAVTHAGNRLSTPADKYPGEKIFPEPFKNLPGKIAWVIGASLLIRRETWMSIHGFDEDYFLYSEEVDLCLRLRRANWKILYYPSVIIEHVGGGSEASISLEKKWQLKKSGLFLFYQKHFSPSEQKHLLKRTARSAQWRLLQLRLKKICWELSPKDEQDFIRQETTLRAAKAKLLKTKPTHLST